jgi:hypothetical protein
MISSHELEPGIFAWVESKYDGKRVSASLKYIRNNQGADLPQAEATAFKTKHIDAINVILTLEHSKAVRLGTPRLSDDLAKF